MAKFVTIGERIHCISPVIRKAMAERDPCLLYTSPQLFVQNLLKY